MAILEAAREVFAERGYARATIREIARRAGVTHGLVMRHFGTKEQLLIEALPGPRAAAGVLPGDLGTLPDRVAAVFVEETESAGGEHALVALIRSAASGEAAAMPLYAAMEREITAAFREVLGPGTEAYADLLSSLLIGVTFARHVARTGALAELTREELRRLSRARDPGAARPGPRRGRGRQVARTPLRSLRIPLPHLPRRAGGGARSGRRSPRPPPRARGR